MVTIIAVANQKGGVAKTTTSGALAAGLKQRGFRVLAVDLDPQGNLSDSAGAEMYEADTIYNLLKQEVSAHDVIQTLEAFDIIPANIMLAGAEQEISQTGKEFRLREALEPVKANYDYIVIDTPPSLGVLTVNAFTAADEVLIPTTAGIFAVNGIQQLYTTIKNTRKYLNPSLRISGVLITRYNPRAIINQNVKELTEQIAGHIGADSFETYIRNSVIIEEAQANHIDVFSYRKDSTVAEDYTAFIDEFLRKEKENGEEQI